MKTTILVMVAAMTMLSGCLFRGHLRPGESRRGRACPPSTYWDNGSCRHNGHKDDDRKDDDRKDDHKHGHDRDGDDRRHD